MPGSSRLPEQITHPTTVNELRWISFACRGPRVLHSYLQAHCDIAAKFPTSSWDHPYFIVFRNFYTYLSAHKYLENGKRFSKLLLIPNKLPTSKMCPKIYLYKRIVQAKLFIDLHFSGNIDLSNIADEACFSKFHFIRLFKTIYGKTPHQYLTLVRIENAKALLEKELSVADTCFAVGFDSVSSFSGLFKRITRFSPSKYQENFRHRREQIKRVPMEFIPNCFAEQQGWRENSNFQEVY